MKNIIFLPTPSRISYIWNSGSLLISFLIIQIITGLIISFKYNPSVEIAFDRISNLIRLSNQGWIIRLIHVNGSSFYFIIIYTHIFRNIMFKSWKLKLAWITGITIYLLSIITAFLGYILPWGQISFWAATVITNLLTTTPFLGREIVLLVWGGYRVSNPTLNRFFSLHFIIPFIIAAIVIVHLIILHLRGSSNPIKISLSKDKIPFHPFFTTKDILGISLLVLILIMTVLSFPFITVDSDNFIMANPIVTPEHIQPEWYFLFAYSILRAVPNKSGGVVAIISRILILYLKPFQKTFSNQFHYRATNIIKISILISSFIILTIIGTNSAEQPYTILIQLFRSLYFLSILVI